MVDPRVIHVMLAEEEVVPLYDTILVETLKSIFFKLVE